MCAAENAHVHIIQYIFDHMALDPDNSDCDYFWRGLAAMSAAARGGHLDTMKYLYRNGCSIGRNTIMEAVRNGRMDIMEWCLEHRFSDWFGQEHAEMSYYCEDDDRIDPSIDGPLELAVLRDRFEMLKFMLGHERKQEYYIRPGKRNISGIYLAVYGCAAIHDRLEILRWLCENYPPSDDEWQAIVRSAIIHDRDTILEWLSKQNGVVIPQRMCMELACEHLQLKSLEWLYQKFGVGAGNLCNMVGTRVCVDVSDVQGIKDHSDKTTEMRMLIHKRNPVVLLGTVYDLCGCVHL
jgi:hypothetical protein